jgi:hypothetical protein
VTALTVSPERESTQAVARIKGHAGRNQMQKKNDSKPAASYHAPSEEMVNIRVTHFADCMPDLLPIELTTVHISYFASSARLMLFSSLRGPLRGVGPANPSASKIDLQRAFNELHGSRLALCPAEER